MLVALSILIVPASNPNVSDFICKVFPAASNLIKLLASPRTKKSPVPSIKIPLLVPLTLVFKVVAPIANTGVVAVESNLILFPPVVNKSISAVFILNVPPLKFI